MRALAASRTAVRRPVVVALAALACVHAWYRVAWFRLLGSLATLGGEDLTLGTWDHGYEPMGSSRVIDLRGVGRIGRLVDGLASENLKIPPDFTKKSTESPPDFQDFRCQRICVEVVSRIASNLVSNLGLD